MGDHEGRPPGQRRRQGFLHGGFVLAVQVAGGLVQDHDGGVLQQHPGDGQPLLLPARQAVTPLAHQRVEAQRQTLDHVQNARVPARRGDLVRRGLRAGVAEVGPHRVVEQVRVLRHDADGGSQRLARDVAQISAVDGDGALVGVVEAQQQRREGGLARTRWPHQRHQLAGGDVEAHAVQRGPRGLLAVGRRLRRRRGQ